MRPYLYIGVTIDYFKKYETFGEKNGTRLGHMPKFTILQQFCQTFHLKFESLIFLRKFLYIRDTSLPENTTR